MTREELLNKLTELGTIDDGAQRRQIVTELTDEVKLVYDSNETLTASNSKYEADNKKLQEYNMQLFLRVGSQQKPQPQEEPEETENLNYEDLFDEKGDLK